MLPPSRPGRNQLPEICNQEICNQSAISKGQLVPFQIHSSRPRIESDDRSWFSQSRQAGARVVAPSTFWFLVLSLCFLFSGFFAYASGADDGTSFGPRQIPRILSPRDRLPAELER